MNEQLTSRLRSCTTLPSLPAIALKIIELANNPDSDIRDVCEYIALDPALSVKILKMANSPLYKSRRSTSNVRQAVGLLGTHTVIVIALSFSLAKSFIKKSEANKVMFDNNLFWRRSIASALACRALGEKLKINYLDDLFLTGLLQDIGILTLIAIAPEEYEPIYTSTNDHDTLLLNEKASFGIGHDEIGYALLKQWHIPDYIAMACIASHCQPCPKEIQTPMLHACTAVSRYLAEYFLSPHEPNNLSKLTCAAQSWLDIDTDLLKDVIDIMAEGLNSVEDLFDVTIHHPSEITHILNEAKELLTIQTVSAVKQLEEKSNRDGLTGALNRRFFDETIQREFHLSSQHQLPLTIAMIDIDHFKNINDTYGHITGDEILMSMSQAIMKQIRQDDYFCRYGGEEFALILPGTPLPAARNVVNRLKKTITELLLKLEDGSSVRITASIGVVSSLNGTSQFEKPTDLIKAADSALYAAKHAGRNQIVEWSYS